MKKTLELNWVECLQSDATSQDCRTDRLSGYIVYIIIMSDDSCLPVPGLARLAITGILIHNHCTLCLLLSHVFCLLFSPPVKTKYEVWSQREKERERERERGHQTVLAPVLPPTDSKQTSISPYTLHKLYGHLTKIIVILNFDQTWLLVNLYIFICRSVGAWVYKSQMKLEEMKSLSIAKSILSIFLETLQCWYRGLNKLDISRSIHIFFCFLKISLSTV